jgi:hypothetical protein
VVKRRDPCDWFNSIRCYKGSTGISTNLSRTKRAIIITTNSTTKSEGEVDPEFTYQIIESSLLNSYLLEGGCF